MSDLFLRFRRAAPLLICVGILFPWAVSPFGIMSCSSHKAYFLPESRSVMRQWLPLESHPNEPTTNKENIPVLGGLAGTDIYYFNGITIIFLISGFFLFGIFRYGLHWPFLAGVILGLLWLYLTLLLLTITYVAETLRLWLQPGVLLITAGYFSLTATGIIEFRTWMVRRAKKNNFQGT